jgi:glutamyl-tRNA synthetase
VSTVEELADAAVYFYRELEPSVQLKQQHYAADIKPALADLHARLVAIDWNRAQIGAAVKAVVTDHKLKMPKLAMPLRVMVTGEAQTPSIDATLELIGREQVLARLQKQLQSFPA